jgi:3-oxoacyl-[acyl-carrier-protein] synthase III
MTMRRCRIESLATSPPRRSPFRWGSVKHAVTAGRRCLSKTRYHPEDVQVLVNAGVHRDEHTCEPAIAAYIQHGLGINIEFQGRRTLAFDLLNGACGMLNAAHIVSALLQAGDARVGMVVSSEANGDAGPDPAYVWPASGAAAILDVSPQKDVGFGAFAFETHEEHADLYSSVVSLAVKRGRILVRRKAELEDAWLEHAGSAVDAVLAADQLTRAAIDIVIPAQISPRFVQQLPARLGLPTEKVLDLTAKLPDTHSTSTFLALHQLVASGKATPGTRALLLAFGSGITVGAASYRF